MKSRVKITLLAVFIGIILGLSVFIIKSKYDNSLNELILEHNEISKLISKHNLNLNDRLYYDENICYSYNKKNINDLLNKISRTYDNAFDEHNVFQKAEDKLYVCIPNNCMFKKLDKKRIKEVKKTKTQKIINYNSEEFILIKTKGVWKFTNPILDCEIQKLVDDE